MEEEGGASFNQDLSQKRAENVMEYLISEGMQPSLISAVGHGEADPIAPNDTAKGHHEPGGNGQYLGTMLGKILRIDVTPRDAYAVPKDNPFVSNPPVPDARQDCHRHEAPHHQEQPIERQYQQRGARAKRSRLRTFIPVG